MTPPGARVKPRLRGVTHQWAFFSAIPLGVLVGLYADTSRARVAGAVFAASVVAMFGASALYHRVNWSPSVRPWLRRLDHACIYGLIAGSYTPFGLLVLSGEWRITVLAIVWTGAAVIGIVLGWVGVLVFPQLLARTGVLASLLVLAGGLCYTLGAVVYAVRKPDPFPAVFGYHELFHALVIAAVAFQYVTVVFFVLPR